MRTLLLGALVSTGLVAGCADTDHPYCVPSGHTPDPALIETVLQQSTASRLVRFASTAQFEAYQRLVQGGLAETGAFGRCGASQGTDESDSVASAAPEEGAGPDESITNNQEAGVDEGDIVKAYKGYLVILRRGRLFTVRLEAGEQQELTPIYRADAYPEGSTLGTWYDEMLIHGDRIVVVGYSYEVGATEIGLFKISDAGQIEHQATHYLRSNDYYSSRNYASRLVNGKLVFYMPYYLFLSWRDQQGSSLPGIKTWKHGAETSNWRPVLRETKIYRPIQPTLRPTLHTVVRCDLDQPQLSCDATAVLGPYSRSFYVSSQAIYVWVSGQWQWYEGQEKQLDAFVYRIPLEGDGIAALRTRGAPIDQFSFKEGDDGYLNVLVASRFPGDAMWQAELAGAEDLALLRTRLSRFGPTAPIVAAEDYTPLPGQRGYALHNRFVGDSLLYGSGNGWLRQQDLQRGVYVLRYASKALVEVPLSHGVDRIEALGGAAVVVGTEGDDLKLSAIELGAAPAVKSTHTRPGAIQGETRSHGFFFKGEADGSGVLGLPVRLWGEPYSHLRHGSAEVLYLAVDADQRVSPLGALSAGMQAGQDDGCVVSCVDWYGNARPIFYRGRLFALMGYELVEGQIEQGSVREIARSDFALPLPH